MASILIIDDDPMIRNMLSQIFALEGYTTAEAENVRMERSDSKCIKTIQPI